MDERWRPQIGDPTAIVWITVVAYGAAALLCLAAARAEAGRARWPRHFWLVLAVALALLSLNKQLDVQSLFTQVVRDWTKAHGWYERRRELQAAFICAIALVGLVALVLAPYVLRRQDTPRKVAVAGMIFLYSFIVIRASSFHHVDLALASTIGSVRLNWMLELGGIFTVSIGAALMLRRSR
jgi:hypothetical protein